MGHNPAGGSLGWGMILPDAAFSATLLPVSPKRAVVNKEPESPWEQLVMEMRPEQSSLGQGSCPGMPQPQLSLSALEMHLTLNAFLKMPPQMAGPHLHPQPDGCSVLGVASGTQQSYHESFPWCLWSTQDTLPAYTHIATPTAETTSRPNPRQDRQPASSPTALPPHPIFGTTHVAFLPQRLTG